MFKIIKKSKISEARLGEIYTNHGIIKTPVFMPPATKASVKALAPDDLQKIGVEMLLVNTLHLHLQPGDDLIKDLGGVHSFMNWSRPILSDSGGFQVWSFRQRGNKQMSQSTEEGVWFQSPLDGRKCFLHPEKSIEIQYNLGSDIIMAFDECAPDSEDKDYIYKAMERTHRWAERSLKEHQRLKELKEKQGEKAPLFFGIVQGGAYYDLRRISASFITNLPIDGIALGGETIGYNIPKTLEIIEWIKDLLPPEKPLYTMGLGASPKDIIEVVKKGVDMFDCVSPARLARHGELYNGFIIEEKGSIRFESEFPEGLLRINQSRFKKDNKPIDENCDCYTCQHFTRAYLHHLYKVQDPLYFRLATLHNLRFIIRLITALRKNV